MIQKLCFRNIQFCFIYPVVLESQFFTADFYIPKHSLIIEIDGDYHNRADQKMRDMVKDSVYDALGYNVLRIKNKDVDTFDTQSIKQFQKKRIIRNITYQKQDKQHLKGRRCNN
jgi:very-short-patch-repair endonuclease